MLMLRQSDKVGYKRRLSDWLQRGTNTGTLDLPCCFLREPFHSYYLLQDAEEFERELNSEVSQRTKGHGVFVEWQNLKFFAVPPLKSLCYLMRLCLCYGMRSRVCGYCVCLFRHVRRIAVVYGLVTIIVIRGRSNKWCFYSSSF